MASRRRTSSGVTKLRHRCQTDLFFLARDILDYDLIEDVHRPVCEFFVQKNPDRPLFEQDTLKQRLLLDPRGHFKTTLDIADTVQWILCFPNIRILLMSGTRDLVSRMAGEVKWHFQYNDKLRVLFPEHCPSGKVSEFGTQEEFTTPARTKGNLREPTVSVSTVDSVKAGTHYDVIKCDDVVHDMNVTTREQIEKTIQAFHYTTPILEPGGFRDVIGTRYDYSDLYGRIIEDGDESWRIFLRPAWRERDGKLEVLFPQRFSVELLRSIQQEDPALFNGQYLNNPIPSESQTFSPELLQRCFIPYTQLPKQEDRRTFITWDLGFSAKSGSDPSVGAVGAFDREGRLFVLDLFRGRFQPNELINAVCISTMKHKPIRIGIESAGGSKLAQPGLEAKAYQMRLHLPIDWLPVSNTKDAKYKRVMALQARAAQGRLFFLKGIPFEEQLITEFTRFPKYVHDDIPDAISLLEHFRTMVDIQYPEGQVPFVAAPTFGDGLLGAGLVG